MKVKEKRTSRGKKKERIKRRGSEEGQEKDLFFFKKKKGASESDAVRQALYNKGKRQGIIYELLHSIILFILTTVYTPNEAYCSFRFCCSFYFFLFSL